MCCTCHAGCMQLQEHLPCLMHAVARARTSNNEQRETFRDMKHMQKRLRNDELQVLRGEVEVGEAQLDNDVADLDTSASEDDAEPVRQAPADFVSEKPSVHTTNKGTEEVTCLLTIIGHCIPKDINTRCAYTVLI